MEKLVLLALVGFVLVLVCIVATTLCKLWRRLQCMRLFDK